MAVRGAKPKPHLQSVREGTFRPDKQAPGAVFPKGCPDEPDWSDLLPGGSALHEDVRAKATSVWAITAPALTVSAGLSNPQRETLVDYCISVARLWQAERALSEEGLVVQTERGFVKNPWTTIAHQYRSQFRSLTGELGLSPASAARVVAPDQGSGDSGVFDF